MMLNTGPKQEGKEKMYKCEYCGQWTEESEMSFFDGHDYQQWAANMVCDECVEDTIKKHEEIKHTYYKSSEL